jgi:positive regulator of sigma E activity
MSVKGIITDKKDGKLIVSVLQEDTSACQHCAARIFCKKSDEGTGTLTLDERPGYNVGDEVSIAQDGNILTKTSLLAYGIPLLFFVAAFFLGGLIPVNNIPAELIQFACACAGLLAGGFIGRKLATRLSKKLTQYILLNSNKKQQ